MLSFIKKSPELPSKFETLGIFFWLNHFKVPVVYVLYAVKVIDHVERLYLRFHGGWAISTFYQAK